MENIRPEKRGAVGEKQTPKNEFLEGKPRAVRQARVPRGIQSPRAPCYPERTPAGSGEAGVAGVAGEADGVGEAGGGGGGRRWTPPACIATAGERAARRVGKNKARVNEKGLRHGGRRAQ